MANNEYVDIELSWDDEVNQESSFQLLEEGDYQFMMINMERGRHQGSRKLPACNKAILTLAILDRDGKKIGTITHNLFLHSSVEGMLSSFFLATGAKKHGEPLNISKGFQNSFGQTGWCHVYIDRWTGDDGKVHESNKIKYFIDPEKAPKAVPVAPAATAAQQTSFSGWGSAGGTNISNK